MNFTSIEGREVQSQHWVSVNVSLFIGIARFLNKKTFDDTSTPLAVDSEVSIKEAAPLDTNSNVYKVKKADGTIVIVDRSVLHHHVFTPLEI